MADNIEDGGPAFPTIHGYVDSFGSLKQKSEGLSLRDWFAGQALAGQLAFSPSDEFNKAHQPSDVASVSYRMADAMLKARKGEL